MSEGDSDDAYICHECIDDSFLKDEVRQEGSARNCHFCGKVRVAWPLDELATRVQGVVEEHFKATAGDRGDPVAYVIAEIAGLDAKIAEAVRARLSEQTYWDAHEGNYDDPFGRDTCYQEGRPDTLDFHESWGFFRREIRTRSRFFGRSAQQALDEIFGDLASLKTWEGTPAIKMMLPTDEARFIFRARIAYSESELRDMLINPVKRLGPPPSRLARAGRMNAAGISVFYGAIERDTCIAEARAPVGSYVVLGRFEIIKPLRVLDLDVLTKVMTGGSWFEPGFTTRSNRAAFLRDLVEEISRPIMPRDEEFEYLPTQVVSEYLASCVEPGFDGIIFHSAQTAREGRNIVLFHRAAGVEPYTLPVNTNVDVNMGWASHDDYDDSIAVLETVPEPKPTPKPTKKEALTKPPSLASILELASENKPGDEQDDDDFYGEPSLKLDVQKLEVFEITAVTYKKAERRVSRNRRAAATDDTEF